MLVECATTSTNNGACLSTTSFTTTTTMSSGSTTITTSVHSISDGISSSGGGSNNSSIGYSVSTASNSNSIGTSWRGGVGAECNGSSGNVKPAADTSDKFHSSATDYKLGHKPEQQQNTGRSMVDVEACLANTPPHLLIRSLSSLSHHSTQLSTLPRSPEQDQVSRKVV